MEQKTYKIYRLTDAVKLRDELVEQAQLQKAHSALLQVYVSRFRSDEIEDILAPFREAFPNLGMVGMTIWGNDQINSEKFVCLSFLTFEESEVEILEYDFDTASQADIIRDAREHLSHTRFAAGVQVIGSHYLANYTSILAQLSEGYENIPFFGSLAINNTEDQMDASEDDSLFVEGGEEDHTPAIEKNYVYAIGSRTILRGMLLVIFSGKGLHVKVDSVLG